jgi:predicted secreted protein
MSNDYESSSPLDAYRPPSAIAEETAVAEPPRTGRIKAICIIAIVLGALGVLSGCAGVAGMAFGNQLQTAMKTFSQSAMSDDEKEAQAEMERSLQAVQDRFWTANVILLAALLVIAAGLLIGGIQCLRRRPSARRILCTACTAAFLFEMVRALVGMFMQTQMMSATMHHMQQMMQGADGGAPAEMDFVITLMRASMIVGIVFGLGWVLAKLVFYGISAWYLRQPHVRAYLEGPSTAALGDRGYLT